MFDFLVRQKWTRRDVTLAGIARNEFRRNRYTSGSAHLDDMIALSKAIILCDSDVRKFKPRAARYELHPAKNMQRIQGNCDVCKAFGKAMLFLPESLALDERKKVEKYKRAMEYASIVAG